MKTARLWSNFNGSYKKERKFLKSCSYAYLSESFGDLFASLVLRFLSKHQVIG